MDAKLKAEIHAHVEENLPTWCAEQGQTVAFTDPAAIAYAITTLRAAKAEYDAEQITRAAAATRP